VYVVQCTDACTLWIVSEFGFTKMHGVGRGVGAMG
jgi:hypothetical protein